MCVDYTVKSAQPQLCLMLIRHFKSYFESDTRLPIFIGLILSTLISTLSIDIGTLLNTTHVKMERTSKTSFQEDMHD